MKTRLLKFAAALFFLASCTETNSRAPFRLSPTLEVAIQTDVLNSVNLLRQTNGLAALRADTALQAAAEYHAADMSKQNRPWHFSSNGQSPLQRVAAQNYHGSFRGEVISESYENQQATISAWMTDPLTQAVILDANAKELGVGIHQDPSGKLWWTVVFGSP